MHKILAKMLINQFAWPFFILENKTRENGVYMLGVFLFLFYYYFCLTVLFI